MNDAFKSPLQPGEIEWKIQATSYGKTVIVPYIDARACYDRLDSCFDSWQTEYREVTDGFICRLTIEYNEKTLTREEGASKTKIEPVKGGISDALKRACHAFGMGRELYDYPTVKIIGETKFIPQEIKDRLKNMTDKFNAGELDKDKYEIPLPNWMKAKQPKKPMSEIEKSLEGDTSNQF